MTAGTIKTKGTRLYFALSASEILKVACPTGATIGGGAADDIDITCLDSEEREFVQGLKTPDDISLPVNFISRSASHQALEALYDSGETVSWMVVLSDQAVAPSA
ncbi:MAG: phage tail tube protein, partial [Rhodoglobus sp.]|nr:phage tail tube protein [Rhodoglobus sp.]